MLASGVKSKSVTAKSKISGGIIEVLTIGNQKSKEDFLVFDFTLDELLI